MTEWASKGLSPGPRVPTSDVHLTAPFPSLSSVLRWLSPPCLLKQKDFLHIAQNVEKSPVWFYKNQWPKIVYLPVSVSALVIKSLGKNSDWPNWITSPPHGPIISQGGDIWSMCSPLCSVEVMSGLSPPERGWELYTGQMQAVEGCEIVSHQSQT